MINTDKRTRAYKDELSRLKRDREIANVKLARDKCTTNEDIIAHAKRYPSWRVSDEDKMLLAESMVPVNAKRLYAKDYEEYKGFLIAGWLGDSQCIQYGLCEGSKEYKDVLSIPHYSFYVCWEPTKEELFKLIKQP